MVLLATVMARDSMALTSGQSHLYLSTAKMLKTLVDLYRVYKDMKTEFTRLFFVKLKTAFYFNALNFG